MARTVLTTDFRYNPDFLQMSQDIGLKLCQLNEQRRNSNPYYQVDDALKTDIDGAFAHLVANEFSERFDLIHTVVNTPVLADNPIPGADITIIKNDESYRWKIDVKYCNGRSYNVPLYKWKNAVYSGEITHYWFVMKNGYNVVRIDQFSVEDVRKWDLEERSETNKFYTKKVVYYGP